MQNNNTINNLYTIKRPLGRGEFSFIYLVRNNNNNIQYAARVRISNSDKFYQELEMTKLASGLNNQNIIHLNNHGTGKIANNGYIANNKII